MADQNGTGGGKHRRPQTEDETDAERTQRHPALQQVVDEFLVNWPTTDPDRS